MPDIFNDDFRDFIRALNKEGVEYIVVGGMAVIIHGYVRTTGDMDVWVKKSKDNYQKLLAAFQRFEMPVFDMTEENFLGDTFNVWSFGRSPVLIEILTAVKGLDFDESYRIAVRYEEQDLSVRILHLNSLLQAKKAAGRFKDLDDIDQLSKK